MNRRLVQIALILFNLMPLFTMAQYSFQKVFGGRGDDRSVKVIETNTGNFIYIGSSTSYPQSNYIAYFSNKGEMMWQRDFGYHGTGAEDKIRDVIVGSDGYIYTGGYGIVWNMEGNPIFSKLDMNGNIVYDSAYRIPLGGSSCGSIDIILDDSLNKTLVSVGFGYDNINVYPMFQKTRYTGERLYYKFIKEVPWLGAFDFYKSIGQNGYTMLCDSHQRSKYLVFLDSSGNFISKRFLFRGTTDQGMYTRNKEGSTLFMSYPFPNNPINGNLTLYSKEGDSLRSKPIPGNGAAGILLNNGTSDFMVLGSATYYLDSLLNIKDSIVNLHTPDSIGIVFTAVAKDGGLFGGWDYFAGNRNLVDEPTDFYFFKTYPDETLNPQVNFMRTGLNELGNQQNANVNLYPNPCNETLNIQTSQKDLTIELYNQLGQKVIEQKAVSVNTGFLPIGVYLVVLRDKNGEMLIRQHLSIIH